MKMLAAWWVLMRLLWRFGIARSKRVLTDALREVVVGDGDKIDDLIMNHDTYIVDLYRQSAKIEGIPLRDFLLKYGLAYEKPKK
jgi:hypothetical protein